MHGNEVNSKEVLIHLIDHLLTNQNKDASVDYVLKNTRVHIMPTMNPDGFEEAVMGDCDGTQGRYNKHGIDLNRNFPDLFECNPKLVMEPETKAVVNWLENNTFLLSANLHGGAVVVNYPFDDYFNSNTEQLSKYSATTDDDVFRVLSLNYSFNHLNMKYSPCNSTSDNFTNGITNGAEWYPISGGMQDFNYWKYGAYEVTLEISCCKYPPESGIENNWLENKKSLVEYLKLANIGVRGTIRYLNGEPAKHVAVGFSSRDPLFKTNENGEYYRLLLPGIYSIYVLVDCNEHLYHNQIEIKNNGLLEYNIILSVNEDKKYIGKFNRYPLFCRMKNQPSCGSSTTSIPSTKPKNISSELKIDNGLVFFITMLFYLNF